MRTEKQEPVRQLAVEAAAIIGCKSTEVQVSRGPDFVEVQMLGRDGDGRTERPRID